MELPVYFRVSKFFPRKFSIYPQLGTRDLKRAVTIRAQTLEVAILELGSTVVAREEDETVECIYCFWPCLAAFRILGLCPIAKNGKHLSVPGSMCSFQWLPTYVLVVFQIIAFTNYVLTLTVGKAEEAESIIEISLYLIAYWQFFFNVIFAILKMKLLPQLLKSFKRLEAACRDKENAKLVRNCLILFLAMEIAHLSSRVLNNISIGKFCPDFDNF